ncbi:uncharacterized protein LOC131946302 isoform X1 [Physella acuta]|uniref:uncharacterized protein LOC131946302 isoform X1 n=1 Tax=Physella acuta TaxID=109671 RepID=UPI0027DBC3E4|nr:uncharacterized protein LOC131946302 isoform X1 [Physella acuta]
MFCKCFSKKSVIAVVTTVLVFCGVLQFQVLSVRLTRHRFSSKVVNWMLYDSTIRDLIGRLHHMIIRDTDAPLRLFSAVCSNETENACISNCTRPLDPDPEARLLDILTSPNLTLSEHQRRLILSMGQAIPESDVIFVSASSSNHYDEMQDMFYSLHKTVYPRVNNFTVVLFDIGLTEEQRIMTEKHCRCQVVTFPFEHFPAHVKENFCYAWKPLLIRAAIEKARKLLVYQDTSVRWSDRIQQVLDRAWDIGIQYFRSDGMARIPLHTLIQTFDYFGEEPCAFNIFPELPGGLSMYRKDVFNIRAILEPWARCAIEPECVCPVNPFKVIWCHGEHKDHRCHRFDQSAIGMITAKIFGRDLYRVLAPERHQFVGVYRGSKRPNYFNSTQS